MCYSGWVLLVGGSSLIVYRLDVYRERDYYCLEMLGDFISTFYLSSLPRLLSLPIRSSLKVIFSRSPSESLPPFPIYYFLPTSPSPSPSFSSSQNILVFDFSSSFSFSFFNPPTHPYFFSNFYFSIGSIVIFLSLYNNRLFLSCYSLLPHSKGLLLFPLFYI